MSDKPTERGCDKPGRPVPAPAPSPMIHGIETRPSWEAPATAPPSDWPVISAGGFRCRKCGAVLDSTDHEARKCPNCGAWTFRTEPEPPAPATLEAPPDYWDYLKANASEVAQWPAWMRGEAKAIKVHPDLADCYLASMKWSPNSTDLEKTLVAGNIRGFLDFLRRLQ